ncbi:MAG TPA: helix-turn-helix domain-containing protein, partial [Azospirillum sp.]|nr:helix-turn-helix domain-containing protein [Azospirillum sp.]
MTQNTLWQPSDISNTEAGAEGGEQESPKRRGRIPQSAWPQILERYRAGATLSAIAREFECTPSAISYIVRKAEAAGMTGSEEGGKPAPPPAPAAAAPAEAPAPAPTAEAPPAPVQPQAANPAPRRSSDAPKPAGDAPKTRLELKREEPRPAPPP